MKEVSIENKEPKLKDLTKDQLAEKFKHIKGWGADADPENEPTYPMKKYTGDDHKRLDYERPPLQEPKVEILHSNERPGLTAVFGTPVPPSGLSGVIRRYAFRHSESSYYHWLPLLIADRVNVVEGLLHDLRRGYIPNVFKELGVKSEWKYNPKGLAQKIVVGAVITTVLYMMFSRRTKRIEESFE